MNEDRTTGRHSMAFPDNLPESGGADSGLTKREYAAIAIAQGIHAGLSSAPHDVPLLAVRQADRLFDQLNQTKNEER